MAEALVTSACSYNYAEANVNVADEYKIGEEEMAVFLLN